MSIPTFTEKPLSNDLSYLLKTLRIEVLTDPEGLSEAMDLLRTHHYLGEFTPVGERLFYSIRDADGRWLGVMAFTSASRRLRHRDAWIGWSDEQRRRRLGLIANNARFLLLPGRTVPNLGSAVLKRVCSRLSDDWQAQYGHPILALETFVDPTLFSGTVYTAAGWEELGQTQGHGRKGRDYYQMHDRPKRLFVRTLRRDARRSLQAETLKPSLRHIDEQAPARCRQNSAELRSLKERFKAQVPEYHKQDCTYPVHALLSIIAAAHLAGAPRGQKDLAVFAASLSQPQRRALGIRRKAGTKYYPSPGQSTFSRMMSQVDIDAVETVLIQWQRQLRGEAPEDEAVCLDGKIPKHSGGKNVLTAVTCPSQHYLGCAVVKDKSNEIPAARELFGKLDLDGKLVSLDALHTQQQTACELAIEHGADYGLTAKGNQPGLQKYIESRLPEPGAPFLSPNSHPGTPS
jgi:hypothetical protein